jgi:hypothetical protein
MAINWNKLRELISYYGPEVIKYWSDPKQRFNELFRRGAPTAPKSVRVAPKGRPEDVEEEYYNRWKNYENMTQGERVGKLNDYQNRGNFGRSQQMLKEVTQNQPTSLENQKKISQRFGPPSPAPKPQQSKPASYTVNDVPLEYQNKTMPESVKPPKPPTYGPSVRIETPKEFLNKPEQSTTDREQLRPTTPQGEIHLPMDEGARIQTPEQFIKKPKKTVKLPKAKPIDITSLPSFPKAESSLKAPTAPTDIDRKRFALLDTYGDTGLKSLNDDEVIKRASLSVRKCYEAAFLVSRLSGGAFDPRWRGKETLDLGAIAKGFALDEAALFYAKKASENSGDVLIDLGGNLISVKGSWKTGVKSPNGKGFASFFSLSSGEAVATSASYYRGAHIRDARTGNVVSNGVLSVTVISKSAMWADALSTVLFILGPNEGMEFLKKLNTSKEYPFRGNDETAVLWIMESGSFVKVDEKGRFKVSN